MFKSPEYAPHGQRNFFVRAKDDIAKGEQTASGEERKETQG